MPDGRRSFVRTVFVATPIMVLGLVAVACQLRPTPETIATAVEVVQVTTELPSEVPTEVPPEVPMEASPEVPTEVPPGGPPEPPLASVDLMVSATPEEVAIWQEQITRFEEETGIKANLIVVPVDKFSEMLLTSIQTENPPDVAVLSYNYVALLKDHLQPLDGWIAELSFEIEDFLESAVVSNTFDEALYGLPLLRSACLPRYRNLAMFEATQSQLAAFRLMEFLTETEQQRQNLDALEWFPTRLSVYQQQGIECPPLQAILPSPEEVSWTVEELVKPRWPGLMPVLVGQTINPYEAATEIIQDESQPHVDSAETTASGVRVTAAPVMTGPRTESDFVQAAQANDVIIGALFLEGDVEDVPAGDYAVRCRLGPKGQIPCHLVKPDGQEITVEFELTFTRAPVGQPFCLAISDSSLCFPIDSRRYCIW